MTQPSLHLRRHPHAVRPLRRRAVVGARRRPRRDAAARADGAQPRASTGQAVDDVIYGCANQAGEDNRNVARMAALLAGLPVERARRHHQPPVRLGHGRGRHRRARDQAPARRS